MLSESDQNLLDAYLDDALSPSEVQRVDTRVSEEPEFAAALDVLRTERAARVAAFNSMAPDASQADQFAGGVVAAVRRKQQSRWLLRGARIVGTLAACIVVGFAVGWVARAHGDSRLVAGGPPPTPASIVHPPANTDPSNHPEVKPLVSPAGMDRKSFSSPPASADPLAKAGLKVSEIAKDDPTRSLFPGLGSRGAVRIEAVTPGSPAADAGLKRGDLLMSIAGQDVPDLHTLTSILAEHKGIVDFQIIRTVDVP